MIIKREVLGSRNVAFPILTQSTIGIVQVEAAVSDADALIMETVSKPIGGY